MGGIVLLLTDDIQFVDVFFFFNKRIWIIRFAQLWDTSIFSINDGNDEAW